ncbi:hypothetical protein U1Q18_001661 [Sarracenia purpurea var. burkii]
MDARSFREFLKKIAQKAVSPSFHEKIVMDARSFREFLKKIAQKVASPSFREEIMRKAAFKIAFKLAYAVATSAGAVQYSCIYEVDGGQRAVIYDCYRGVRDETIGEGYHIVVPWLQEYIMFDTRYTPHTFSIVARIKDLQMVELIVTFLSRHEVSQLTTIYQTLGPSYDKVVFPSIGDEVMKAAVAEFHTDELVTDSPRVLSIIREKMNTRAKKFNIVIDIVAMLHISFKDAFHKAVEGKMVEQQEVERSKLLIAKVEEEKMAEIIWAQGESECAKLISDATKAYGIDFLELKRIKTLKEILYILSKNPNVSYLPKESDVSLELKVKLDKSRDVREDAGAGVAELEADVERCLQDYLLAKRRGRRLLDK